MAEVRNQPYPPAKVDPEIERAGFLDASRLDAFFHAIDANYGSFQAYVRDGLKLSNEDVQNLRRRFLTD
jgi:hypothetical protein